MEEKTIEREFGNLRVYSADGRLIINNMTVNNQEAKIDLSRLKTGNYIATTTLDDGSIRSFKVLKK